LKPQQTYPDNLTEYVVLVDRDNNEVGLMEKQEAHQKAVLHRAFSVFVFNDKGELLIQQRAQTKYHSAGLWTNTCCSHPRAGEHILDAADRRLKEEMGVSCKLKERFNFIYKTPFENGLCEHELDFVFTGIFNGMPDVNPTEVQSCKWITLEDLIQELHLHPQIFTSWFQIILKEYLEHLSPQYHLK
jgi:isopentenyl-diphosphate delta-isomerase